MSINLNGLVNELRTILGKMEVALGAIADAIVWTGRDGKIQWCNSAFDQLVNQPHILVLNATLSDLLCLSLAGEAVAPEFYPNMRVLEGDCKITEEYEFYNGNRCLILEISGNCVELPGGDRSSVLVIRDITQAKRWETERTLAEQKQAETLSLLQATLESTADGILVINQDFHVALFNHKFLQMWSIPESLLQPSQSNERFKFMSKQTRDPEAFASRVKQLFYEFPEQAAFDLVEMKDGRVFERYSQPQWQDNQIIGRVWSFRDITARQQAEKALSESEAKFRRIVENSNDIISLIDLEGRISYISPNLTKLTGYDTTELEGIPFADFIHPDDLPSCLDAVNRVVTTGERIEVEYRARIKDGSWQWQATNLATTQDENDNFILISVARVITERKQAEAALLKSEQKFRRLFENSQFGILRSRLEDGLVLDANQRLAELLGYSCVADLIGTKFTTEFYANPSDRQRVINQLHQTGSLKNFELKFYRRDGKMCWGLFSLRWNVEDSCLEAVVADISDRKQAEADLHRSNAILKAQQEASIDGILVVDENHNIVSFNQRFCQLWQIPETIVSGNNRRLLQLVLDKLENPQEFLAKVEYLYAHPEEVCRDEIRLKDGRTLDRYSASVRSQTEDYYGRIWYFRDISDRKRSEETLRRSEQKYRNIFENFQVGIARIRTEDGLFLEANQRQAQILGYNSAADLIGKQFTTEFYANPEERQKLLAELKQQGEVRNFEVQLRRRDQSLGWGLLSLRQNVEEGCIDAVIADISEQQAALRERKLAEESLRQSEARFRALYESTSIAVMLQQEGISLDCNRAAEELFGYSRQEFLSKHPSDFSPPFQPNGQPSADLAREQIALAYERGRHRFEWVHRRADGTDFPAEVWLTVFELDGRKLIQGMVQDLTERKQVEATLQYRAQVDRLLNSISRQFIDRDADTAINFTLQAIAEFLGAECSCIFEYYEQQQQFYIAHEWHEPSIALLLDSATAYEPLSWFYRQILNGNPIQSLQVSHITQLPPEAIAQTELIKSVVAVPMIYSGKVVGLLELDAVDKSKTWSQEEINLLQRVSELIAIGRSRHKAEEALRIAKEAAETANRSKSAFLANMSHELRTPLNAILGFAQLMERDTTLTQRQRDSLAIINRSGEHLLNLINDVLEMSKIEAGRVVLQPKSFDLYGLLQNLQDMFRVRAEAKNLTLAFELAPNLPQYIFTDESKLRQILINLLSNAIKFTSTGGVTLVAKIGKNDQKSEITANIFSPSELRKILSIETTALAKNESQSTNEADHSFFISFEIADTGLGIAEDELDSLFQPFVQTASGSQAREGTGLGLTISRQFVQLMGGDIQLKSAVGHGSTFYFDIKIELAQSLEIAPQTVPRKVIALAPGQPVYRILIVDDRKDNCDLLTQLFNTIGFETLAAANGQEAIALWQAWHPHLIWMDMRMPIMDGYEATRQIRAMEQVQIQSSNPKPRTVIIALTASAFEEQRSNILAAGCDDLIRKPFREEVLFNKIVEFLRVNYIYAQEQENTAPLTSVHPQDLMIMPDEWRNALYQAAIQVDAEVILQLIAQIPETHLALFERLTDLVNRFCFDEIIELIPL
ncbi:PAS domain S-box protein [Nostoc sp. FACHB-152]|uniref:PAS domain S-box protein n=1 Tax=unclassified Nostoc TaxID=2593658 RepID=UPI0016886A97|nr:MULTISPECIES: PAS domain S-box protein [unclassified Nostoc]MBD2449036.1 PAS domain S-box protein [Nostoc sp. FACHB-152]MBD2469767.1 PAS domain S-box protein [Nostoc sp. FACHB-145]